MDKHRDNKENRHNVLSYVQCDGALIYIIKQDIRIYVPNRRPNGWTEWTDIFLG